MSKFVITVKDGREIYAMVSGKIASHVTVCDIEFQWAKDSYLMIGGIANVGTDPQYRRKGLAKACMKRANRLIMEKGYPCGGVSTGKKNVARRLYSSSGYTHLFFIDSYWKKPRKRSGKYNMNNLEVRPYVTGDENAAVKLFRETYGGFFGLRRKTGKEWIETRRETLESAPESYFFAELNGETVGYCGYFRKWRRLLAGELIVSRIPSRIKVAKILLRHLENQLAIEGLNNVSVWLTNEDREMTRFLECCGYIRMKSRVFMLNILSLTGLLKKLSPCIERRASDTLSGWKGSVQFKVPGSSVTLLLNDYVHVFDGPISSKPAVKVYAGKEELTRILAGNLTFLESYLRGNINIKPSPSLETFKVLNTLFPRIPHFHPVDDWW
ncbi:GNAT family N-acetyltransferase [Candidatus Bathyarchaeota archaeon]|nr:MAG: GNAT family N-acetyltransferase [Candidatus Bathyarchaeota archaeon]